MKFLGFEAYITIDGVELTQYEIKTDEGAKTASCWIPSEAGKSFAIHWKPSEPRPYDMASLVHVDGVGIGGKIRGRNSSDLSSQGGYSTSSTTWRPIIFAPIQLTDDDAYLSSERTKGLGDITLQIDRIEQKETLHRLKKDIYLEGKIHERSKKAMVHRVNFGEEVVSKNSTRIVDVTLISTLATFTFRYRSLGKYNVLRADGIAPPAPKAPLTRGEKRKVGEMGEGEETENKEPEDDEEEEDIAELRAQLRLIQEKLDRKAGKSKAKKVKTEPKARSSLISGEIIDLT
ncbi:hypothetical protein D9615_009732 [Tricholomella constricta]|uniref:DUF7918 domain-containing protein n=1 Tax=Tricholomella constricta TaxID=117010 RepID=A0A8H5GT40_9AGAR|nr:hypothetical protein D9615_009732 [Tricholomella constricta]